MPTATLTSKGQITIPREVRDRLKVSTGDRLEFVLEGDGTVTIRTSRRPVRELYGLLHRPGIGGLSAAEMDSEVAEVVAEDFEAGRKRK